MNDIEKLVAARRRAQQHLAEIDEELAAARERQKELQKERKKERTAPKAAPQTSSLLRFPELMKLLGYKVHESVYHLAERDPTFPQPRVLGGRSVAWVRSEVEEWIAARPVSKSTVWTRKRPDSSAG